MNTQSTDPNWTPIIPTQEQYDEMRYVSILKSRWTRTSQQLPFSDDSSSLILKCRQFVSGNVGLLLVASAQLFFSLMNLGVKVVSTIDPPVHTLELIILRMAITYVCCIAYMHATNVPDPWFGPKDVRILLIIRGICGFTGIFGLYFSLQYLSLSDATVLTFLVPLATAVSGALLLNEAFSVREGIAGLFSLFGVILIARPPLLFGIKAAIEGSDDVTPAQRILAVCVSLIGVCGATGAYTVLRAIGTRAHSMHSLVAFSYVSVSFGVLAMFILRIPVVIPADIKWLSLLLLIGFSGFIAQTLLTMGLQRETAGRAANALYIQIVFAVGLEQLLFGSVPTNLSLAGIVIIMFAALYVAVTKKKDTVEISLDHPEELALEEGLLDADLPDKEETAQ